MLMGINIDERPLMSVNILKFFEKSFGSPELSRIFEMSKGNNHLKILNMTLEELKNGMREYFKKYKHLMTDKEEEEFKNAILEVSITKDLSDGPSKEKSDYAIIVGAGYAIRLYGKTVEEAHEMYEQAVMDYKNLPVTIYRSFSLYE